MALELERLVARYEADTRDFDRGVRQVQRQLRETDRAASNFGRGFDRSVAGFGRSVGGLQRTLGGMSAAVLNVGTAVTALGGALAAREVIAYADAWTLANDRVGQAEDVHNDTAGAVDALFDAAQDTRREFSQIVDLYSSAAQAGREFGASQQDLLTATTAIAQTMRLSGTAIESQNAALFQFGQAIRSPRVQMEEFNSILDGSPRLLKAIIDGLNELNPGLNVTAGNIRQLITEGEGLSGEQLFRAVLTQADQVGREFERTSLTIAEGARKVDNAIGRLIGTQGQATGAASGIAEALSELADVLGTQDMVENVDLLVSRFGRFFELIGDSIGVVRNVGVEFRALAENVDFSEWSGHAGQIKTVVDELRAFAGAEPQTFEDALNSTAARVGEWIDQMRDAGIATREFFDVDLTKPQLDRALETINEEINETRRNLEERLAAGLIDPAAEAEADALTERLKELALQAEDTRAKLDALTGEREIQLRVGRGPQVAAGALEDQARSRAEVPSFRLPNQATRVGGLDDQARPEAPTPSDVQFGPNPFAFLTREVPEPEQARERAEPPVEAVREYLAGLQEEVRLTQAAVGERERVEAVIRAEAAALREKRQLTEDERRQVEEIVAARQEAQAGAEFASLTASIEEEIRILEAVESERDAIRAVIEAENIAKRAGRDLTLEELARVEELAARRDLARVQDENRRDPGFGRDVDPAAQDLEAAMQARLELLEEERATWIRLGDAIDDSITSGVVSLLSFQRGLEDIGDVAVETGQRIATAFLQTGIEAAVGGIGQSILGGFGFGGAAPSAASPLAVSGFTSAPSGLSGPFASPRFNAPFSFAAEGGAFGGGEVIRVGEHRAETVAFTAGAPGAIVYPFASGGGFAGGQTLRVGESGPETVVTLPGGGGYVIPYATGGGAIPFQQGGAFGGARLPDAPRIDPPEIVLPDLAREIARANAEASRDQRGSGEAPVVNVFDQRARGAPIQTETRRGPDGRQVIDVMVMDSLERAVRSGDADALFEKYGTKRQADA